MATQYPSYEKIKPKLEQFLALADKLSGKEWATDYNIKSQGEERPFYLGLSWHDDADADKTATVSIESSGYANELEIDSRCSKKSFISSFSTFMGELTEVAPKELIKSSKFLKLAEVVYLDVQQKLKDAKDIAKHSNTELRFTFDKKQFLVIPNGLEWIDLSSRPLSGKDWNKADDLASILYEANFWTAIVDENQNRPSFRHKFAAHKLKAAFDFALYGMVYGKEKAYQVTKTKALSEENYFEL
jgi:hypothetical protein